MEKEKDFYSPAETAKALGIFERQVFGMLCSGELDGQQDEYARWWVPASSIKRAQRSLEPSSGADGSFENDAEALTTEREAHGGGAPQTTVRSDDTPLRRSQAGVDVLGREEVTREADHETLVPASHPSTSYVRPARGTEGDEHYTADEAARGLGVSPACVRRMLRAGELEGERREERIEGVLGPWRIPKRAVHELKEGSPSLLRAKRWKVCEAEATTASPSPEEEAEATTLSSGSLLPPDEVDAEGPSEVLEVLSQSVKEIREKAEALLEDLEILEGRLELVEMAESASQEALRRERERADRERERAYKLQAELEAQRAQQGTQKRGFWRQVSGE